MKTTRLRLQRCVWELHDYVQMIINDQMSETMNLGESLNSFDILI